MTGVSHRTSLTYLNQRDIIIQFFPINVRKFIEELADIDPAAKIYHQHGSKRSGELNTSSHLKEIRKQCKLKQCYLNCQTILLESNEFDYFEGYVQNENIPIRHAWMEKDNQIFELTLPWHDITNRDITYFGVKYTEKTVLEALVEEEAAYPLAGRFHREEP